MGDIREKSACTWRVRFQNFDRQPVTPATVRYRLDDRTTGQSTEVIGWTDLAAQAVATIVIPAGANRILNSSNPFETRVLTVQCDADLDTQFSDEIEYRIRNLSGFN